MIFPNYVLMIPKSFPNLPRNYCHVTFKNIKRPTSSIEWIPNIYGNNCWENNSCEAK